MNRGESRLPRSSGVTLRVRTGPLRRAALRWRPLWRLWVRRVVKPLGPSPSRPRTVPRLLIPCPMGLHRIFMAYCRAWSGVPTLPCWGQDYAAVPLFQFLSDEGHAAVVAVEGALGRSAEADAGLDAKGRACVGVGFRPLWATVAAGAACEDAATLLAFTRSQGRHSVTSFTKSSERVTVAAAPCRA